MADAQPLDWLNLALLGVCGGGVIPNVLSAVVLVKERNSIPGARILLGLAVADGGLLTFTGTLAGLQIWDAKIINHQDGPPWVSFGLFCSHFWMWMAGIYLVIALATGRYIAVNKPHLAKIWNSKGRQGTIVVVVFTVTLLLTLVWIPGKIIIVCRPHANVSHDHHRTMYNPQLDMMVHILGISPDKDRGTCLEANTRMDQSFPGSSSTKCVTSKTDSGSTGTYQSHKPISFWCFTFPFVVCLVFLYLIPLPCLFMINIRFLRGLRRFQNRRKRFAQTQTEFTSSSQVRIILNVAVILGVFLVCQATSLAMWVCLAVDNRRDSHVYVHVWAKTALLFTALNSANNFWVYLVFLKEFRLAVVRMMACICYSCTNRQEN